jgi:hypothetical protein
MLLHLRVGDSVQANQMLERLGLVRFHRSLLYDLPCKLAAFGLRIDS